MYDLSGLGLRIRQLRMQKGFTQDSFAKELGVELEWCEAPGVHDWKSWNLYLPKAFEFIHKCRVEAGLEK